MTKWEYQVFQVTDHPADMVAMLNQLGGEGWEWVEVLAHTPGPAPGMNGARHILFRRPVTK